MGGTEKRRTEHWKKDIKSSERKTSRTGKERQGE